MKSKVLFIMLLIFSFFMFETYVLAEDISISELSPVSSNGAVDVSMNNNNGTIDFETSLRYIGHYSQYKVEFENGSDNDYLIHLPENINDKVIYEYTVDGDVIKAHSTKEILIKVSYGELYTNVEIHSDGGEYLLLNRSDTIIFERVENAEPEPEDPPTPSTPKEITRVMKHNQKEPINKIINVPEEVLGEISFEIEDPDILVIEEGNIIPLKVGETNIDFDYDQTHYLVHVIVTEDDLNNPNTKDIILIISIIFGVSFIIFISFKNRDLGIKITYVLTICLLLSRTIPIIVLAEDNTIEFVFNYNVKILPQRYHVNRYETNSTIYSCDTCGSDHYYGETGTMTVRQARAQYIYTGQTNTSNSVFTAYFIPVSGPKRTITNEDEVLKNESEGYYQFYYNRKVCLDGESLIIVYDEKKKKKDKKKLKDIDEDDLILCWDFDKGEFVFAKPLWIKKPELVDSYHLLQFENGYSIKVIGDHKLFCVNKNRFMNAGNDNEFEVGDSVYTSTGEIVKLISHETIFENIDSYSVITEHHLNMFANDLLTSCVFSNMHEIKDMKYLIDDRKKVDVSKLRVSQKYIKGARLEEVPAEFRGTEEETIKYINEYFENLEIKKR